MGEYCAAAAAAAAAEGEPAVALVPPPAAAAKRPYGEYDRCSTKQVFDNLHGNITLDPVSSERLPWLPSLPLSSPPPSIGGVVVAVALVSLRRLVAGAELR